MTYDVAHEQGVIGSSGTTRKPLRGSARGKVFRGLVTESIARLGYTRLENCIQAFNLRYSPAMPHSNAVAIVRKAMAQGKLRWLPKGVIAGPAANGPLLPLLKLCHPDAYDLLMVMVKRYPLSTPTRRLIDLSGRVMTHHQLYEALRVLERQGVVRWDKAHTGLNIHHARPAELLGGRFPTDLRPLVADAPPVDQVQEDPEIQAYFDRIKAKRSEGDDVIDPTDGGTVIPADEPSIFD